MFDLISIGNIAIDLYFKDKSLTFRQGRFQLAVGGKYFTSYFYSGVGGGGANVAIGAQQNGLKTALFGKIGNNPFKEVILHALKKAEVTTYLCQPEDNYINISSILINDKGDRSIIHFETPHQKLIHNEKDLFRLKQTRCVYFGNMPDIALSRRMELLHFFQQNAILIVANLGVKDCRRPRKQLKDLIEKVDVIIVNCHEFSDMVKKNYGTIDFQKNVCHYFSPLQKKIVVVTDGERGSFGYQNGDVILQSAVPVKKVIDATGAGDGYTAGFIAEYCKSHDIRKAMRAGAQYASRILQRIGAN